MPELMAVVMAALCAYVLIVLPFRYIRKKVADSQD